MNEPFYSGEDAVEEFLEHYGILGMKWGVRRTPEELGHLRGQGARKIEKKISRIEGPHTPDEDQAVINPKYNSNDLGYKTNCGNCSIAYDMRRRGFDVKAKRSTDLRGLRVKDVLSCYTDPKTGKSPTSGVSTWDDMPYRYSSKQKTEAIDSLVRQLSDSKRTNGIAYFAWAGTLGGHFVNWDITNSKLTIRDAQTNKKRDFKSDMDFCSGFLFVGTNDCEINDNVLKYVERRDGK